MKSASYWQKRSEEVAQRQYVKADQYTEKLRKEYDRAKQSMSNSADVFYQRFAINNEISLVEARKLLNAGEMKEFKMTLEEFITKAKDNADGRWTKELNNVYYRTRISRFDALQIQVRQQVEMLAASQQSGVSALLGDVYKDSYHRTIFEIEKGIGLSTSFARLDQTGIDAAIKTQWAGSNYSKRIWGNRDKIVTELQTKMTQSFIRGDSVDRMTRDLMDRMDVSYSNAARIVRTEGSFFTHQASMDGYKASGVVDRYEFMATLDNRTSSICQSMDTKVFKLSEMDVGVNYPPLHANCRSTTSPFFDDEEDVGERIAKDRTGKTVYIPGDMSYEEWHKKYIE